MSNTTKEITDRAEHAIRAFGITDRTTAARALRFWAHRNQLTTEQIRTVLHRFPGLDRDRDDRASDRDRQTCPRCGERLAALDGVVEHDLVPGPGHPCRLEVTR
jgi:hypothetical protein